MGALEAIGLKGQKQSEQKALPERSNLMGNSMEERLLAFSKIRGFLAQMSVLAQISSSSLQGNP